MLDTGGLTGRCNIGNHDVGYGKCFFHMPDGQCSCRKAKCEWDMDEPEEELGEAEHEQREQTPELTTTRMLCPRCGMSLKYDGKREYENLCEHVSCLANDPKWHPPLRPVFVCRDCFPTAYYDADGHIYSGGSQMIPGKYWDALNSYAFDAWFRVHEITKTSGYEELKKEKLSLPDEPLVVP